MKLTTKWIALITIFTLSMSGCQSDKEESDTPDNNEEEVVSKALELSAAEQQAINKQQEISLQIFSNICDDEKNVVISPISATMALSVYANALESNDANVLAQKLGFESLTSLNVFNKGLLEDLPKVDPNETTLTLANAIWANNKKISAIDNVFLSSLTDNYLGEARLRDFTDKDVLADEINSWADKNTNHLIKTVISKDYIDSSHPLYIFNAIYFKGNWTYKFDAKNTKSAEFYDAIGAVIGNASMMSLSLGLEYASSSEMEAIKLPYGNKMYNMIVILPAKDVSYADALKSAISTKYTRRNANLKLPKFKLYQTNNFTRYLRNAGINMTAYLPMAKEENTPELDQISTIVVDESGTEAAAVSSLLVTSSGNSSSDDTINFNVNRPFCFIIEEANSHALLFIGKVSEPE
jgi:serpin B